MSKTGKGLADYAISKIGTPYFYGSKMTKLTESFMKQMHKAYPSVVTDSYIAKAIRKKQVGKVNVDCSGLVGAYRGKQIGSAQLYASAKKRMPISKVKDFAVGTVLWKEGHVGVYIGKGYCVEAKGIDYGTIKSKVSDTKWVYGLTFSDMSYDYKTKVSGTSRSKNPYTEPEFTVHKGDKGDSVKWVQTELKEAGYNIAVDGIFGDKTFKTVKKFQKSCKIAVDGIVGKDTKKHLKAN